MSTALRHPGDSDEPLLANPFPRKELRAAGLGAISVGALCLLGFAPSWLQFFAAGQLHLDPWFEVGLPLSVPWWLLRSHAELATLWGLLAILQAMLGMGLIPGAPRRLHRVLGYLLILLGVLAFGSGSLLEILEYGGCVTWLHLLEAVMIFLHFGLLVYFARAKKHIEHAWTVLSLFLWTFYPGWARICGFLLEFQLHIPCGLHAWDGYEFFAGYACAGALLLLSRGQRRLAQTASRTDRGPFLTSASVLLLSSAVFSAYSLVDLVNAYVSDTFLRCPG